MASLTLADSWARLDWTRTLVGRVQPLVSAIDDHDRRGEVACETRVRGDFEHARYRFTRSVAVPGSVGFTISDIAVNARSCLDMAVQAIVWAYDLPIRAPQFPIAIDVTNSRDNRVRQLVRAMPEAFVRALESLQPRYETAWGRFDEPLNSAVLMIQEISNANKHRNITPVLRIRQIVGHRVLGDLYVEVVGGAESAWPTGVDGVLLEVRYPRGAATEDQLSRLSPARDVKLMIHQSGYQVGGTGLEVPVGAAEFLDLVPTYVEGALTILERAHGRVSRGEV